MSTGVGSFDLSLMLSFSLATYTSKPKSLKFFATRLLSLNSPVVDIECAKYIFIVLHSPYECKSRNHL